MELRFVFLVIISLAEYHVGKAIVTFERHLIKVKSGKQECISQNCTPVNNPLVACAVHECGTLESSNSTAQAVDVEDVYLEIYQSTDSQVNLGLHVEWSPIDNVSSDKLKGFKIDISDGITQHSKCYRIDTELPWSSFKKDIFYYDCFGKPVEPVVPGSNITVSILPLPLNKDVSSQKTVIRVEVPDCSNEELHSLTACAFPGGRPTSKGCIENCTTFSVMNGDKHHVHCNIDRPSIGSYGQCTNNRTGNIRGVPSSPDGIERTQYWYKYIDAETGDVKIALNFTWSPSPDSSIRDLTGYKVTVMADAHPPYIQCFTIHNELTVLQHNKVIFYYDCYGRNSQRLVKPGHKYRVYIYSIPNNGKLLLFDIPIPSCASPMVQDVTECIENTDIYMKIKVENIFCSNRTLYLSYLATPEFGSNFYIMFCERGTFDRKECKVPLKRIEIDQPSGTVYFSLPSNANLSIGYNVYIHAYAVSARSYAYPDFTVCIPATSSTTVALITAICVIAVALVAFAIWFFFFRHKCGFWIFKKAKAPRPEYHVSARHPPSDAEEIPVKLPGPAKVYVVFADDHDLHRNVIHWFCSFLQRDLGLTVKVHIWELNTTAFSRPQYVLNNLNGSDKVVVICSEGSKAALENQDVGNMYAPVIRQLCADSLAARNPEKYVIGYFSYTKSECIPDMLRSHIKMYSPAFKLMDQLEQFYFRLLGIEQYQDQGILKINEIDQYFKPASMSESALKLQHAISKMTELTHIHPNWPRHLQGQETNIEKTLEPIPQGPTALYEYESITDFQAGQSNITHLLTASPPPLTNGKRESEKPVNRDAMVNGRNGSTAQQHLPYLNQNHIQNSNQAAPRQMPQPYNNGGSVSYHAQDQAVRWTSPIRQPAEHASRQPCEHDTTVASMDSSFEISESEDLNSTIPSKTVPEVEPKQTPVTPNFEQSKSIDSMNFNNLSYRPESFNTGDFMTTHDFENGYDSQVLTFLPSTSTQATDIDEKSLQQKSDEVDHLMNQQPMERKPSTSNSPEAGLITLAVIDEEDDLDLEDQIKSINLSAIF